MNTSTHSHHKRNVRIYRLQPAPPAASAAAPALHPVQAALAAQAAAEAAAAKATRQAARQLPRATPASAPVTVAPAPPAGATVRLAADPRAPARALAPRPAPQPLHPTQWPTPAPGKSILKVGLDIDRQRLTATIQWDHLQPKPPRDFKSSADLLAWVKEQTAAGHVVYTVYESCGFGYCLHYDLVAAGAVSLVITPTLLDRARRRKNDRLDSAQLCLRLSRYVDGHLKELHVIRVPQVEEQQRRETGRQRAFWRGLVLQLANHGRALRLEHEGQTLPGHWWGPRVWQRLEPELTPFVRGFLEPLREQILAAQEQVDQLTAELEARVAHEKIPKGLGALTLALADAEVCDWFRFADRKAPASYTGCCPSERSTGGVQRTGRIDRHGNAHLRTLLVEAVWRLARWNPTWHAYRKLMSRLSAGGQLPKRWAVALARQLAVDLWRVRTGRATWAELGFLEMN
jgi:transposase